MRICLVHNAYGRFSGEEAVVVFVQRLLLEHGHQVSTFFRGSDEIPKMRWGKARAFVNGIYSISSRREMRRHLAEQRPDLVHIHNLYPFISPSILPECRAAGVPVVMTVHNYRLICPNGLHMVRGQVCLKCAGGHEIQCIVNRCEESLAKCVGYAARNWFARKARFFLDNVTMYAALTAFQRERLIQDGYPADRIVVIPNAVTTDGERNLDDIGSYLGFVGRVSPEKNVGAIVTAARHLEHVPFKIAGSLERMPDLAYGASSNIEWLGHVEQGMSDFYAKARAILLPSLWFEGFPMVLAEAMLHAKPVICSRIGGLPEIVEDGVTGLLVEPQDTDGFIDRIRYLWERPELCRKMGRVGREKVLREYTPQRYYERLIAVYQAARELGPGGGTSAPHTGDS